MVPGLSLAGSEGCARGPRHTEWSHPPGDWLLGPLARMDSGSARNPLSQYPTGLLSGVQGGRDRLGERPAEVTWRTRAPLSAPVRPQVGRGVLPGGRGGRLMSPFCFTVTPLQAPPSSEPSSRAPTCCRHGQREGAPEEGEWPELGCGRGSCLPAPVSAPRIGSVEPLCSTRVSRKATRFPRPGSGVISLPTQRPWNGVNKAPAGLCFAIQFSREGAEHAAGAP